MKWESKGLLTKALKAAGLQHIYQQQRSIGKGRESKGKGIANIGLDSANPRIGFKVFPRV